MFPVCAGVIHIFALLLIAAMLLRQLHTLL
jgi:hypothetical protein